MEIIRGIQIGHLNLPVTTSCKDNPQEPPQNLLDLIYEFSKAVGYTINTPNKQCEKEIIPIYNSIQKNKMARNKFNKAVKDSYAENYKTLLKEMKDLNKWKEICFHALEDVYY